LAQELVITAQCNPTFNTARQSVQERWEMIEAFTDFVQPTKSARQQETLLAAYARPESI
jgi:hypothetical protein